MVSVVVSIPMREMFAAANGTVPNAQQAEQGVHENAAS